MGFKAIVLLACSVFALGCGQRYSIGLSSAQSVKSAGDAPSGGSNSDGTGTGTNGGSGNTSAVAVTDTFNVLASRKADILFIVDNSSSMSNEQTVLSNSFSGFIASFLTKNIDANIGIVSTDVRAANGSNGTWTYSAYSNYPNAGPGRLLSRSSERFLNTVTTSNFASKFTSNVNLGTKGSGDERALNSLQLALDPAMVSATGYNKDFIRDDALFIAVVVGDEDNGLSPMEFSVANAQTVIDATLSKVNALKLGKGGFRFDFVINKSVVQPDPMPTYLRTNCDGSCPALYYPAVFRQFAGELGIPESGLIDIETNFAAPLAALGDSISSQAQKQFSLSKHPSSVSSIHVYIDSTEIAQDPTNGWSYITSTNSIELDGAALQNVVGHQLKVQYVGN